MNYLNTALYETGITKAPILSAHECRLRESKYVSFGHTAQDRYRNRESAAERMSQTLHLPFVDCIILTSAAPSSSFWEINTVLVALGSALMGP